MNKIEKLIQNARSLSAEKLMEALFHQQKFRDLIIYLNTESQLYQKGIDSTGRRLDNIGGPYAPYTVQFKTEKGQPTDRVTLKDTGEFYNSFRVYISGRQIEIKADSIKEDGVDLLVEWGKDILGLTEESLIILRSEALKIILPYLKKELLS